MEEKKSAREAAIEQDQQDLRRLGYGQQLLREMGGFSNFAISFSIISILTGAVLLFGYGLKFAGPFINTVGWPVVSLLTLCVAGSMAELTSAYPTAGGLYFWAFRLGGRGWAWVTAWLNMIGQVTITAGINYAAATYLIGAISHLLNIPQEAAVPLLGRIDQWNFQIAVMALITVSHILVNLRGNRVISRLNDFSVYWHILGVLAIVAALLLLGKHRNSLAFMLHLGGTVNPLEAASAELPGKGSVPALVFGDIKVPSPLFALFPALAEWYRAAPAGLLVLLGLLQAQWTYTGFDASAHVAEETVMARLNAAWGVFLSVAVSAGAGYLMLLVLTWCIPNGDIAATAADPYPVLQIARGNLPPAAANGVALIIGVAMWLCGAASVTSMARMWWAFARDGGMIGSEWLRRVDAKSGVPVCAVIVTSVLAVAVCLYAAAYYVVTSVSTITLYLAYGIPIYLNWRNRSRGRGEHAVAAGALWTLGKWGPLVNGIALGWILFLAVVFSLPPNELVLWTMLGLTLVLGAYWLLAAGRHFHGPRGAASEATSPDS